MNNLVNPFIRGKVLRRKLVKGEDILCVDFASTLQAEDIKKRTDLIADADTGKYAYRAKINIKEIDDPERRKKGLMPFDFSDDSKIIKALNDDFDFPLWFVRRAKDDLVEIKKWNLPLIYQIKGCNFHDGSNSGGCKYCFVDNEINSPWKKNSVYLSAKNVANTFESIRDKLNLHHIRISGGEPTIVLDHIYDVLKEMDKRGLEDEGLQFDCNLSTGNLIEYFIDKGVFEEHILEKIAEYDPKVLVAFKGTDNLNIEQNTQTKLTLEDQIYTLKLLTQAGLDCYPSLYNPNVFTLDYFAEKLLDNFEESILNKIHLYPLKTYKPTEERLKHIARENGMDAQEYILSCQTAWDNNYSKGVETWKNIVRQKTGLEYKQIERPGIEIKVKEKN